jgi:inositol-phosphate phosphatase/L-galactose 1-phosphate phosphatase/histidinol-phosphatase
MAEADRFIALAGAMADAVRPVVLRYFGEGVGYDVKADASPVTRADREAEAAMRRIIEHAFPEHGILGEEYGPARIDASHVWVLDPIDGTKSFVTGKPLFGTLIALVRDGVPVVGIIDMPALDERWIGAEGQVTVFNGRPVRARACADLRHAWIYATSPQMFVGADGDAFERLRRRCYASVYGADCYAYGLLARGRVDLVCEASTQPYDFCALVPVVTGAGGMISDWQGRPLDLASDGRVLAAGDVAAHAAARRALAG